MPTMKKTYTQPKLAKGARLSAVTATVVVSVDIKAPE
jgi:hypothetical protein